MEGQQQLPGCEPPANLRGRGERGKVDRHGIAARCHGRHELSAAGCQRVIGLPIRLHRGGIASTTGGQGRRKRAAELSHLGDGRGELRLTSDQGGPASRGGGRKTPRVGREQPLQGDPAAAQRLRGQPTMPHRRLGRLDRGLLAATGRHRHPGVEGVVSLGRQRCQRTQRIGGEVPRPRIGEELRKQGVGLPIRKCRRARRDFIHEVGRLKEPWRPRPLDRDRGIELGIAAGHVARRILNQPASVGGLRGERALAASGSEQSTVDVFERRGGPPHVSQTAEPLGLEGQEPRPQRRQIPAGPLAAAANRRGHAAGTGHRIRGERQLKRLLEGPSVAGVGGGVGGLLEEFRGPLWLIGIQRHPTQDDQPPAGEPMIELVAHEQAAGEQRRRKILFALRPVGGTKGDVDPRLRPVIGGRGPPHQRLGGRVEPTALGGQVAEE